MQKTKLGVTVSLLAAAICFVAAFGGYVATIILVGYVLLKEEDEWLRKTGVRALAIMIGFSFLSTIIGFVPDGSGIINNLCIIFDSTFEYEKLNQIVFLAKGILNLVEAIVLIVMGCRALKYTEMKFGPIDKIVDKHI